MRQEEARLKNECNGASAPQKRPPNRRMVTESPKSSGARLHFSDCASEDTVGEHASESRRMQRRVAGNEGENQTCTSQRASWPRCASRSGAMPRSGRHGRAPMLWGPGKLGRLGVLCTHSGRSRVSIRPLAFLVSGSTAESSSSSRALATGNATLGVQGLAGDHHDQDPAAGRRWQQLWSPSTSR